MSNNDRSRRPASSNEMFYMENGVKSDAALHAQLLDGVDDSEEIRAVRERMLADGMDPKTVDKLWPETPIPDQAS